MSNIIDQNHMFHNVIYGCLDCENATDEIRKGNGMTNEVNWNERFNIGVDVIDKAHQKLFSIVRRLIVLSQDERSSRWACAEGIKYFKYYTMKHFAEEEEYMRSIGYSGYEMHKRLHDNLRDMTLPALEKDFIASDYSQESIQHFLGICFGWLTGHIMVEDRTITGRIANKWNEANMGKEAGKMEDVVSYVMEEVFKLQTEIVSEHYSGEDFGKSIYYRLSYRVGDRNVVHVFLAFEEGLMMWAVGEMLGVQIKKVDRIVVNAAKQLSLQLINRIGVYFGVTEKYHFEKVYLLTKEQFEKEFAVGYPYYSLLFDTGKGYFAFCTKLHQETELH